MKRMEQIEDLLAALNPRCPKCDGTNIAGLYWCADCGHAWGPWASVPIVHSPPTYSTDSITVEVHIEEEE